jgi:glycosyltransferase involved in cell wall biosynthesis
MRTTPNAAISVLEEHGALLESNFKIVYASGKKNKILRLLHMVITLLRWQRKADFVLISVYSTLNFYYAWLIALLCRGLGKPYIAYLHGGNLPARLLGSPRMSHMIFAHAYANVAPSGYLQAAFEKAGFKTRLIPNFIQLVQYPFVQRSKIRPRLLWVRSFEKTYHPEMTLRVFAKIYPKYPDARLCMVGPDKDGSLETCKLLAETLGLSNVIEFTGGLPKNEWIARAADFDLFLSTTQFDNTPVSILEALALGMPVVSTSVGGIPYLLEHGEDALLSPDGGVAAMVENLEKLLENPALAARLSQNARRKAAKFDWKVVEEQWLKLLR